MSHTKPTMLLITAPAKDQKTFNLIPIDKDCPYTEGIYRPEYKLLELVSVIREQKHIMMPKLTESGDIETLKIKRDDGSGNEKRQRVLMEINVKYYILEKEEIIEIIKMLAINHTSYDFVKYLTVNESLIKPLETPKIELVNQ